MLSLVSYADCCAKPPGREGLAVHMDVATPPIEDTIHRLTPLSGRLNV